MHDQLKDHFDMLLSKYKCGFRKGFSTKNCLLAITEKLQKSLDSGWLQLLFWLTSLKRLIVCRMTYCKATCLRYQSIKKWSLNFLFSYLENRKQRVRLNNIYSEWIDILFGVSQGSILDPLLFKVFLCNLFLFHHDIPVANYADGNNPYCTGLKICWCIHWCSN